jgi:hypothetical protein
VSGSQQLLVNKFFVFKLQAPCAEITPHWQCRKHSQQAVCHTLIDFSKVLVEFSQSQAIKFERKMHFHDLELYLGNE